MKLKEYIEMVLQNIPEGRTVNFDIGVGSGYKGEIHVDKNSASKIKFSVKNESPITVKTMTKSPTRNGQKKDECPICGGLLWRNPVSGSDSCTNTECPYDTS